MNPTAEESTGRVDSAPVRQSPDRPSTGRPSFGRPSFGWARRHGVAVTEISDETVSVAYRDAPGGELALTTWQELQRHYRRQVQARPMEETAFDDLLARLYEHGAGAASEVAADISDSNLSLTDSLADALPEPKDLLETDDDAPIIRLLNAVLTEAVKEGASDVHIEPFENRLAVRFRIDGVLREVLSPDARIAPHVVSRVKIMARLDIAEKRLPQDGRISLRIAGRPIDVRVSTIPAGHGERVVMRLLDKQAGRLDLEQLGMRDADRERLNQLIGRPHGILLVTGPTGSGKTTTLYAALARLNDRSRNIMTVEDPVEYYIDGIGQTQVNTRVDMSFARGLRAILRQDPDVVLVGEIRDVETARIAVQASLTGHLVMSTLHTNTAAGAVTRLADMGIEPFLLSSSLIGVLAQRLVRQLCSQCRQPRQPTEPEREALALATDAQVFDPVGCGQCRDTGYVGRTGLYELIIIDETLRELIHDHAGEAALVQAARSAEKSSNEGGSLAADGRAKILAGVTTPAEVLRVTRETGT